MAETALFERLDSPKWFDGLSDRKILNFPHCGKSRIFLSLEKYFVISNHSILS